MTEDTQAVAQTIAKQMGGTNRLRAMVNARNFVAHSGDGGLSFKFSGSRKANFCRVMYDASIDLYNFELLRIHNHGLDITPVYETKGAYDDMLIEMFESETGLYLSL